MVKGNPKEPVNRGMLDEAVEAVLKGMDNLYERFTNEVKPLKGDLSALKKDVGSIKTEITFIKRDIQDIKVDLSDTPSRRESEKLEEHVQLPH